MQEIPLLFFALSAYYIFMHMTLLTQSLLCHGFRMLMKKKSGFPKVTNNNALCLGEVYSSSLYLSNYPCLCSTFTVMTQRNIFQ